jgi:hypothetical protein
MLAEATKQLKEFRAKSARWSDAWTLLCATTVTGPQLFYGAYVDTKR